MSSRRSHVARNRPFPLFAGLFSLEIGAGCVCAALWLEILEIDWLIPGFSGRLRPHSAGRGMSDSAVYALEGA